MQLVHRYGRIDHEYNWNVAAEIVCLIAAAFLVIALILTILSIWTQRNHKKPILDQQPSQSALLMPSYVSPVKSSLQQKNMYGGHCFNS